MLLLLLLQIFASTQGKDVSLKYCPRDVGYNEINQQYFGKEKLRFQFYYETGCPYSIDMYTEQLEKTFIELAPYLDITTYPYGNARMILNESQLIIQCQHGEPECYGNRLHACAIDALKVPTKYIAFNACMMRYNNSVISNDEAADTCGKKMNVDSNEIKACAKSTQGFQLLLYYGIESSKVKYLGVPWWYVNGVSMPDDEERPLKEILCSSFKNPPDVCKNMSNFV